jgi:ATP diphosphatase
MSRAVAQLRETISRLRAPGGCPWDREQTVATLIPSLLEEAHEVADAIECGTPADAGEELGDLLINILMQAEIASEQGDFDLEGMADAANEKLIRRHPHVFGETAAEVSSSGEVLAQWEEIKKGERAAKGLPAVHSHLDGVALGFPALVRAQKIQKKAAKVGFDWRRPEDVVEKIREETDEVEAEIPLRKQEGVTERLTEEVGDLLFAVVNLSRALGIDAESALREATRKFEARFRAMEAALPSGRKFTELSFDEMNALWELVKQSEGKTSASIPA